MTYTYIVDPNEITLTIEDSVLNFAGKTIPITNSRYAVSYYASANHYEREGNTISILFEKMTGKTRANLLDRTLKVDSLHNIIPSGFPTVPVYLDLVDASGIRTLVQLNLNDQACQDFLSELMGLNPDGYLGIGNQNNTNSALGLNQANKVIMYVVFAVLFFIAMITIGVVVSSTR
ncbi:MAG: hypothetical protein ACI837_002115 [Crocinitomicaceae bacterium]|jgi:hypothetical protein